MYTGRTFAFLVALAAGLITTVCPLARAETINIPSNAGWEVWTNPPAPATGTYVGVAQNVCLDGFTPTNCPTLATPPAPATVYGYTFGGWAANLSALPNPHWMWAPGVNGATRPAEGQSYTFKSTFSLCGPPMDSDVWVSADNRADVYVNGTRVLGNADNAVLDHAMVPAALLRRIPGYNTIEIKATNDANPPNCGMGAANTNGAYSCNPAGVVFNGAFEDALNPWPRCTAAMPPGTMTYHVGESEDIGACPAGWTGRIYHTCICSFDAVGTVIGDWAMPVNTCTPPLPPTSVCLDFDGLAAGTVYGSSVGQAPGDLAFTNQGVRVTVEAPLFSSFFGDVVIDNVSAGIGANQSIRFRNAGLRFDLASLGFTPARISFDYNYKGGEYSLESDSSVTPVTSLSKLLLQVPPSPLPNVGASTVTITPLPPGGSGSITRGTLTLGGGSPRWLEIGGQELWIDNLCMFE